ncbi:MAG: transposase [Blautia wexlerae]
MGISAFLHTWGSAMNYHPHVLPLFLGDTMSK